MARRVARRKRDAFISHASADLAIAREIEAALQSAGLEAWLDDSEIQLGVLLAGELQGSIADCRTLILLWSAKAARSRWVNTEWIAAHMLDRFILPAVSDDTALPQCFEHSVYLDLRRGRKAALGRLTRAVKETKPGANRMAPPLRAQSKELSDAIAAIAAGQAKVTAALLARKLKTAAATQQKLDVVMRRALALWPLDPMIVKLDGYHIKNGYMIKHWDAIQAGRGPADTALERAERRFFEALRLDPADHEGLDGIGSIFFMRRDLYAAEFFFTHAIERARRQGIDYDAATENLANVRRYLRQP